MSHLAHVGDMLAMHARMYPDKVGARDLEREMTFRVWYNRACRLANALLGIGLSKSDRVCILAYNCVEWVEIYAATAIAGLIAVPVNFRLSGKEFQHIVENCDAKAFIVQDELLEAVEIRARRTPGSCAKLHCFRQPKCARLSRLRGSNCEGTRHKAQHKCAGR